MSEGIRFSVPADLTFEEIKLSISRTFGTFVRQSFTNGDDSFCSITLVAGNQLHDVTVSRNGEPGTPFHKMISVSTYDDPGASLDQFREIAHSLGGTFYTISPDGDEVVLPYQAPDENSAEFLLFKELSELVGRDAAATIVYVSQDAGKRAILAEIISQLVVNEPNVCNTH